MIQTVTMNQFFGECFDLEKKNNAFNNFEMLFIQLTETCEGKAYEILIGKWIFGNYTSM